MEKFAACLVVIFASFLVLGLAVCLWYLVAWGTVAVAAGFGHEIPFWPTFWAYLLLSVVVGLLRGSK